MDFLNVLVETEIHVVTKILEKYISIVREKYGRALTSQGFWFLQYFGWSRYPYNSQNMGIVNFHSKGKVSESPNIPKLMGFLNILVEAEIHKFIEIWEK